MQAPVLTSAQYVEIFKQTVQSCIQIIRAGKSYSKAPPQQNLLTSLRSAIRHCEQGRYFECRAALATALLEGAPFFEYDVNDAVFRGIFKPVRTLLRTAAQNLLDNIIKERQSIDKRCQEAWRVSFEKELAKSPVLHKMDERETSACRLGRCTDPFDKSPGAGRSDSGERNSSDVTDKISNSNPFTFPKPPNTCGRSDLHRENYGYWRRLSGAELKLHDREPEERILWKSTILEEKPRGGEEESELNHDRLLSDVSRLEIEESDVEPEEWTKEDEKNFDYDTYYGSGWYLE